MSVNIILIFRPETFSLPDTSRQDSGRVSHPAFYSLSADLYVYCRTTAVFNTVEYTTNMPRQAETTFGTLQNIIEPDQAFLKRSMVE